MINKRPVTQIDLPSYPESPRDEMGRRSFLTMLGIGAAGATMIGSCGPEEPGHGTRDPGGRKAGIEPNPEPPVVPLAGVPRRPDLHDTDNSSSEPKIQVLPKIVVPGLMDNSTDPTAPLYSGHPRALHLEDRTQVMYVLYFSYNGEAGRAEIVRRSETMLTVVDKHLAKNCSYDSLATQEAIDQYRETIRPILARLTNKLEGVTFLDMEFTSVRKHARKMGRAPAPRNKGGVGKFKGNKDPLEGLDL